MASIGTSSRGRRNRLLLLAVLAATVVLGARPRPATASLDRGLGRSAAEQLEEEIGLVRDPALTGWVERLGSATVQAEGGDPREYFFKILDADDVNAFAIPGGWVYVTRGLLRFVESEDELAAVIGHEITHVAAHHGVKQLQRDLLLTLALTLLRGHVPDSVSMLGQVGGVLYSLKYSRGDEATADQQGITRIARAGFEPAAMAGFLRKLQEKEKHPPSRFQVYFMTHPPTAERLEKATRHPDAGAGNLAVRLATANGLAGRGLYRQAMSRYEEVVRREPGNAEAHLGLARCWDRLGEPARARKEYARARALGAAAADTSHEATLSSSWPPAPVAARADTIAAADGVVKARRAVTAGREGRAKAAAAIRKSLDASKRSFRGLLGTLNVAAGSTDAADLQRQRLLYRIALAVAAIEKAIGRIDGIVEAGETVPDDLSRYADMLESRLATPPVDGGLVAIARGFEPATAQALVELDQSLEECRKGVRLVDGGIRACQVAAQDLAESSLLPSPFLMARFGQIDSRTRAAASGADQAARTVEAAAARADAADARRRILALDLLGQQTPRAQRPAVYSLLTHRFAVPEAQVAALVAESAPLGEATSSLLLGMAVRVPLKPRPAKRGEAAAEEPPVTDTRPVKPLSLDEAIERRVPLPPLNLGLRSLSLDVARETGSAAPR